MSRLSNQAHWDAVHRREQARGPGAGPGKPRGLPGRALRRIIGPTLRARMGAYDQHLLWNVLFKRHLAGFRGTRAMEVGSAPGTFILKFARTFGCEPFGVEYSEVGVEVNRRLFRENGFPTGNVIHDDFFSEALHRDHRESFDILISRGFIEHFSDVDAVIDRHVNLLRPGGYLLVSVPNIRGVNYALTRLLHPALIPMHNLDIMTPEAFHALFDRSDLETLHCGHYGTFTFYLFYAPPGSLLRFPLRLAQWFQPLLNLTFRTLFGDRGAESGLFSPSLIFIGRKRAPRTIDAGSRGMTVPGEG